MANAIESRVMALAEPLCVEQGAELVAVEWQKAGRDWILRLYIDSAEGVGHELCVNVSRAVGDALDAQDFIEPSYNLEVSSPGLERPLLKPADFERFAGQPVSIKLFAAQNGQKQFYGELAGYKPEEGVALLEENSGQRLAFALDKIAKAHLVFKF